MKIAIDGPAASGKGTIAKGLARHFKLPHLDTGLLYRAVGLSMMGRLLEPNLADLAEKEAANLDISQLDETVLGRADVALAAAKVARIPRVRAALRQLQVDFAAQEGGAILDGRDIGSRICPDADVKLFITASPEIRAKRRYAQLTRMGQKADEAQILEQIIARDESDRTNPAGAFYISEDAHLLDTSELDIEGALNAAIAIVNGTVSDGLGA
ncbi:MAG TPA: (d)CMP kinase [Devosia sp.]|nr:(d)CMP kinase [Devosia sp.]